ADRHDSVDLITGAWTTDALSLEPTMDGVEVVVVVNGRAMRAAPRHVGGKAAVGDGGVVLVPALLQVGHELGDDRGRGGHVAACRQYRPRRLDVDRVCRHRRLPSRRFPHVRARVTLLTATQPSYRDGG